MRRCSAIHTDTPTLICALDSGHKGWHHDETYGPWLPVAAANGGDPGVRMPRARQVREFNAVVDASYTDLAVCVGVTARVGRR